VSNFIKIWTNGAPASHEHQILWEMLEIHRAATWPLTLREIQCPIYGRPYERLHDHSRDRMV
jgi:hypothetical protein